MVSTFDGIIGSEGRHDFPQPPHGTERAGLVAPHCPRPGPTVPAPWAAASPICHLPQSCYFGSGLTSNNELCFPSNSVTPSTDPVHKVLWGPQGRARRRSPGCGRQLRPMHHLSGDSLFLESSLQTRVLYQAVQPQLGANTCR